MYKCRFGCDDVITAAAADEDRIVGRRVTE